MTVDELWKGSLVEGQEVGRKLDMERQAPAEVIHLFYGGSDVDLHIYAPDGRHAGRDYGKGTIDNGIPGVLALGTDSGSHEQIRIDPARAPEGLRWAVVGMSVPVPEEFRIVRERWSSAVKPIVTLTPERTMLAASSGDDSRGVIVQARELTCVRGPGIVEVRLRGAQRGAVLSPTRFKMPPCGAVDLRVEVPPTARPGDTWHLSLSGPDGASLATAQIQVGAPLGRHDWSSPLPSVASVKGGPAALVAALVLSGVGFVAFFAWLVLRRERSSVNSRAGPPSGTPVHAFSRIPGPRLRFVDPSGVSRVFPFPNGALRIGREQDNHLVVYDLHVSRYHATLSRDESSMWLTNHAAPSATLVDGDSLPCEEPVRVASGCTIRLAGGTSIVIESG